ncbi:hypothetical protein C8R45DRAFT_1091693 [Mycena sanguinolenta]|nr:hypothetical protein C8R45DRAFT_1091693 [Mycena sanguinolenta]
MYVHADSAAHVNGRVTAQRGDDGESIALVAAEESQAREAYRSVLSTSPLSAPAPAGLVSRSPFSSGSPSVSLSHTTKQPRYTAGPQASNPTRSRRARLTIPAICPWLALVLQSGMHSQLAPLVPDR